MMLNEKIRNYYLEQDMNCSEDLILSANDEYNLGLDRETLKVMSGFGGGFGCGSVCGAVCGALGAISYLAVDGRAHATEGFGNLCGEFMALVEQEMGSTLCCELKAKYRNETERCVPTCEKVGQLLEQFLKSHNLVE